MEKIIRLHPLRGFFLEDGLHLVNPERPQRLLPEDYVPSKHVIQAIKAGVLIDINGNILVDEKKVTAKKEVKAEVEAEVATEEVEAEEKPSAKKTTSKKK